MKTAGKVSKTSAASKANAKTNELQKKIDELNATIDTLKSENEQLRGKLKMLCKKVVDSVDLSQYEFIEPSIEPEEIDIKDLMHMVQRLALLAMQVNTSDNIESHMEVLEQRISELSNENGTFFKNKLKLQDRLEFIMQERDVWKRNAETLKKMYAKLVKEQSMPLNSKCLIGAYKENIDQKNPNQRTFIATVPKNYYENYRNSNLGTIQINNIDQKVSSQLLHIQNSCASSPRSNSEVEMSFFQKSEFNSPRNPPTQMQMNSATSLYSNSESFDSFKNIPNFDDTNNNKKLNSPEKSNEIVLDNSEYHKKCTTTVELLERPSTGKKNVSFNKEIDVRIFQKNAKNSKAVDAYSLPLTLQTISAEAKAQSEINLSEIKTSLTPNLEVKPEVIQPAKTLLTKRNSFSDLSTFGLSWQQQRQLNNSQLNSANNSTENRFMNRGSVCSNRKLPGETPVRELEPTLKMIIIKELSVEKIDGNDWRMFARRIGISENEVKDWVAQKLQYPMARVLSFWSSKPEATARLLHRHLNAPCFNYGVLAKRIENFYDVI